MSEATAQEATGSTETGGEWLPDAEDTETVEQPGEAAEPEGSGEDTNPNKEAAKYRTRLRETEAERDKLTDQLTAMQRAEVERIAADTLHDAEDVWRAGVDLAGLVSEDGTVDADAVGKAVAAVVTERPHLHRSYRVGPPSRKPAERLRGGSNPDADTEAPSWAKLLHANK